MLGNHLPARQLWMANRSLPFVFLLNILIGTLEIIAVSASLGLCLLRVATPMVLVRVDRSCLSSSSLILFVLARALCDVVVEILTGTYGMGSVAHSGRTKSSSSSSSTYASITQTLLSLRIFTSSPVALLMMQLRSWPVLSSLSNTTR